MAPRHLCLGAGSSVPRVISGQKSTTYMKESNTLSANATIKQLIMDIWLNTKGQCMKESNTLADNATIKQLIKVVLSNTIGNFLKESSTLASNVAIKQLQRII